MKTLAHFFDEDVDIWSTTGLLHDIDYEKTLLEPEKRGAVGAEILENLDFDGTIVYAVKAHYDVQGMERKRKLDKILYAVDSVSELIVECAKNTASGKLADLTLETVIEGFRDKSFADKVDRDKIKECEKVGLSLEKFLEVSLDSIKSIADQLEL